MYMYKPIGRLVDISRLLRRKENPKGENNVRLQIPNHSMRTTFKWYIKASPDHRCGRYQLISGATSWLQGQQEGQRWRADGLSWIPPYVWGEGRGPLCEGMRDDVRASRKRWRWGEWRLVSCLCTGVLPRVTEQAVWEPPQHAVLSLVPQAFWCTGNTPAKGSPACSLLVNHARLPVVTWITFRDKSSHVLSMYLIPPKMGGSSDALFCITVL